MAVGDILCHYDSDGNYPVYGFGGKVPWLNNQVSHCFPLKYEFLKISTKKLFTFKKKIRNQTNSFFKKLTLTFVDFFPPKSIECTNRELTNLHLISL